MAHREPNFFLVGAAKAGTTALHRFLSLHTDIYMSSIKEPNYFSQKDIFQDLFNRNYRHAVNFNLDKYLRGPMTRQLHIADVRDWDDYLRLYRNVRTETAVGEASNSYLFCPSAAAAIAERIPDAKILILVRNPIDRAWSHYLMNLRLGYTLSDNFIDEFNNDSKKNTRGWGITHNYLELGLYSYQIERYLSIFPNNQVKVVLYDDYYNSRSRILSEIYDYLSVDPTFNIESNIRANQAAIPRFPKINYLMFRFGLAAILKRVSPPRVTTFAERILFSKSNLPTLGQKEKSFLRDIYSEDIRKLANILDCNLGHWLDDG